MRRRVETNEISALIGHLPFKSVNNDKRITFWLMQFSCRAYSYAAPAMRALAEGLAGTAPGPDAPKSG
ncbi:hypothetical protein, partial [Bordetella pertussis]